MWNLEIGTDDIKNPYTARSQPKIYLVNDKTGEKLEFKSFETAKKEMEKRNKEK